jgi:cobalt/nickel transport system permease protein
MHLPDGIVKPELFIGGYIISAILTGYSLKKINPENIPKVAIMTAAFFVASLINIPIGGASIHLSLNGILGIMLGRLSMASIFVGLILQSIMFQHGGLSMIGLTSLSLGLPAFIVHYIFKRLKGTNLYLSIWAGILSALAIIMTTIITASILLYTGEEIQSLVKSLVVGYLPVSAIEGLATFYIVRFLLSIKPDMLNR